VLLYTYLMLHATAVARLGLNIHMTTSMTTATSTILNALRASTHRVLGTTITGYGAGLVSRDVSTGTVISTSSYHVLVDDLRRCWIHQTGSLDGFISSEDLPQVGEKVSQKFLNTLTALTATITLNAYVTTSSQLTQDSLDSSTSTVYYNNTLTYQVDYTFTDHNSANYFFNLGGKIAAGLSHAAGVYVDNTAIWATFIEWANSKISSATYARNQWTTPTSINTSYNSGTNLVRLGIFPKNNPSTTNTVTVVVTVTNSIATVSIPTTATTYITYSTTGTAIQGYYGVASPIPQASIVTSFGSGQTPPVVPTKILTVSQPTNFAFPSNSNSDTQTITVTNAGNSTCTVSSITYPTLPNITTDIAYPGDIAPPWSIDPGATHTFNVRYFGLNGLTAGTYAGYFSVYSPDSITSPVSVNTQLLVADPIFDFYLSPDQWNNTYTYGDKRIITQPVNVVAKDNFTSINYGTDTNFLSSGFSIKDSLSVVGFDISFNPTGLSNSATYITTATITINSVPHNFTATVVLNAPAAPVTQHLGDWVSAYQADNGVIGASYDIIDGVRYITLGFGMGADGGGSVAATTGSNVNVVNLGTGSDVNFAVGPVLYASTSSIADVFLKPYPDGYGVWVNDTGWYPVDIFATRTYTFIAPVQGSNYTYKFAADNQSSYFIIGENTNSVFTVGEGFFTLTSGIKTLTIYFCNPDTGQYDSINNPGAVALIIKDPNGFIIWDSNLPVRTSYTPYRYWNEVCRIPLYDSTTTDAVYYSKDYLIKNLCPLYGYSYGSWFGDTGSVQEGSMFTVTQSPFNDIDIKLNSKSTRDVANKTTNYASYLFFYYTDLIGTDRITQLDPNPGTGNATRYFTGFDRNGTVTTSLRKSDPPYVPPAPEIPSGGGSGSGGGCPDPATPIMVSANGYTRPAGQLVVGNRVWTRHETTGEFNNYAITAVEIVEQPRVQIQFDDGTDMIVSDTHKFLMQDLEWRQVFQLSAGNIIKGSVVDKTIAGMEPIGVGPVVKITVDRAHTYIAGGLISHNTKNSSYTDVVDQ
jgi:hypothetical protein